MSEQDSLLSLEDQVEDISNRYIVDSNFRDMVHKYMSVSDLKSRALSIGEKLLSFKIGNYTPARSFLGKILVANHYDRMTDEIVTDYATLIHEQMQSLPEVEEEKARVREAEEELKRQEAVLKAADEEREKLETSYVEIETEKNRELSDIDMTHRRRLNTLREEESRLREKIEDDLDPAKVAREKLKDYLANSAMLTTTDEGEVKFDDEVLMERLEEVFLDEIIKDLEGKNGSSGFMAKTRTLYSGLIDHWSDMTDLAQLADTDWTASLIEARMRGYRVPRKREHFIVGVPGGVELGQASIDTAITCDGSRSMYQQNRIEAAKKTGLGLHALMRRVNEKNNTYFSVYSNDIQPITPYDFYHKFKPGGWTRTDLALKWLYETLEHSGPSIAYLLTDGIPARNERDDVMGACIENAKKFSNSPQIKLRIVLIDGNERAYDVIKKIGRAAGPDTKVLEVDSTNLAGDVIMDISSCIGEMYEIEHYL